MGGVERRAVGETERVVERASGQQVVDRRVAARLPVVSRRVVAAAHLVSRADRPARVDDGRAPPPQRRRHQPVVDPGPSHHQRRNRRPREPRSLRDEIVLGVLQRRRAADRFRTFSVSTGVLWNGRASFGRRTSVSGFCVGRLFRQRGAVYVHVIQQSPSVVHW